MKVYLYDLKKSVELQDSLIPELERKSSNVRTNAKPYHINIVKGSKRVHHFVSGEAIKFLRDLK